MSPPRLAALTALAAGLLAPGGPAFAGVRSTDASGACLYWGPRSVSYRINPARVGTSPSCGPLSATDAAAAAAVEAGFAAWTGAQQGCTDLQLVRGADTAEVRIGYDQVGGGNENLIVFRKGWCALDPAASKDPCMTDPAVRCSDTYGCFENSGSFAGTKVIALTTTTYDPESGEIFDADMEFVDWTGLNGTYAVRDEGWYFTCLDPSGVSACGAYGQADCYGMDLQNTATHEAGHFLGLAHTPVSGATMYAQAAPGEISKRTLEADDLSGPGLCDIYPKGGPTLTCVSPKSKSSGGCASAEGAGVLGLLGLGLGLAGQGRRSPSRVPVRPERRRRPAAP